MEQLVNFIIRPPRAEYSPKHDLLDQEFVLEGKLYQRKDVEIKNSQGYVLQCSHYVPIVSPEGKPLPCVIYCHGNSGCRADASEAAMLLLPSNITVFALDFSGSGLSGGEHVTLGWNERNDLRAAVEYLRQDGNVSLIGLWGRSMGAVTSLMYGAEDPSIAGMVLDSPFSDLVDLMMELVDTYKIRLPKFTVRFAIQYMRKAIQKKAKFDIVELNTIKVAQSCFVPALFGHAINDDFIQPHHSDRIFEAYVGDKNIIKFEGDHNSSRPQFYFDSIDIFFRNVLQPPKDEVRVSYFDTVHDYFNQDNWITVHQLRVNPKSLAASKAQSSSSTVDGVNQVHAKRPLSRMDVPSNNPTDDNQSDAEVLSCPLPSPVDKPGNRHDDESSNMISFELSNGHPCGLHVPTLSEDGDNYMEYELDDLVGFPSSIEEEEKMLMAAVMESLKDLKMQEPNSKEPEPLRKEPPEHQDPMKPVATNTATETREPSKVDSISSSMIGSQNSAGSTSTSAPGSSSETNVSGRTKVTRTVERNPMNNVTDSLMRRWNFNFFRNTQ